MKRLLVTAVAIPLLLVIFRIELQEPASAQTTDNERAFVYGVNAAIPDNYIGTFAPPAAQRIYLLAGQTSVISPRLTEIYFWPITNEYRANWNLLNEPVPGVLEVSRNGAVVAEIGTTDYTIHFTRLETRTTAEIFLGQAAIDAEAGFRARQGAFQEAASEYNRAQRVWLDAAAEAGARQETGEAVSLPPAPERPEPIGIFSNGLNQGMPIDLGPEDYDIRLKGADGKTVPGSERALTIFAPRRAGVGYTVVPGTRWTTPAESPAPSDVIFGEAGSSLYLEPHLAREYPARAWALLQDPQRPGVTVVGWNWVNGERLTSGTLEVIVGDRVVAQRALTRYAVEQLSGGRLGYEVKEFIASDDSASPDFEAYPIRLETAGDRYSIRLRSAQGETVPDSGRLVRAPANPPLSRLLVLSAVPLVLGAVVIARRQRLVRKPRTVTG